MKSIMHEKDGTCYLCILLNRDYRTHRYVEEHHVIYGKGNRPLSEKYGLKAYLCPEHHRTSKEAVHQNVHNDLILKKQAQRIFEKTHSRKEFMETFGQNYIDIEEEQDQYSIPEEASWGFIPLPETDILLPDEGFLMINKKQAVEKLTDEQFRSMMNILDTLI